MRVGFREGREKWRGGGKGGRERREKGGERDFHFV